MDKCEICGNKLTKKETDAPLCEDRLLCDECATERAAYCEKCEERILPYSFKKILQCKCGNKFWCNSIDWQEE